MIDTICNSGLFTSWTDPVSGIQSWVLTKQIAPLQSSFYFTNRSWTEDGRFLWLYVAYPPSGSANYGRMLAVIDFVEGTFQVYPETNFLDASPMIDLHTGEAYWISGLDFWKRGPRPSDGVIKVNSFPSEWSNFRQPYRISTHLTLSADGKWLGVDAQIGHDWYLGAAAVDGSTVEIWQQFDRCYNHAQFSPTDCELQLIAQDWWFDASTGSKGSADNRMWLLRRGEKAFPLREDGSAQQTHEWWSANGEYVWYVDYEKGTERIHIASGKVENIWPNGTCHSHADTTQFYVVGDIGTYDWKNGCRVAFYNRKTNREINLVSDLPYTERTRYHTDPHPQFCLGDRWICSTTTVLGSVTLALTDVNQLIAATS
ncbi:hypothetical protein [Paenibacillus roseipurpureus]|uniref:Uncharacterized protein n=1 Tax=Paenibacillus roseopurpureus TaxID=2918901 RepID=A0AA96LM07_9BACL|nr:hypothetical protein [Paenibacillus sp. MBLB1832]WNR43454.1 hypothetical protein MJB10_20430 [Paenibacillus sp. MBLB1832]